MSNEIKDLLYQLKFVNSAIMNNPNVSKTTKLHLEAAIEIAEELNNGVRDLPPSF